MTKKLTNRELADVVKRELGGNVLERAYNKTEIKTIQAVSIKLLEELFSAYTVHSEELSTKWHNLREAKEYDKASELITTNLFRFAKVVHMMSSEDVTPFGLIIKEMPELVIGTIINNVPHRILIQEKEFYRLIPIDEAKSQSHKVFPAVSNTNELLSFISSNKYIINELKDGEQLIILKGKFI